MSHDSLNYEQVDEKSYYAKCESCGDTRFKIIVTPIDEYGESFDFECLKCGEIHMGVISDPFCPYCGGRTA